MEADRSLKQSCEAMFEYTMKGIAAMHDDAAYLILAAHLAQAARELHEICQTEILIANARRN